MKLECTKEKLYTAVNKAERVTSKNSTLPILSCILLETKDDSLFIRSTNLDIGLELEVSAKIIEKGRIVVPAQLFSSFLNSIQNEDKLTLELKDNVLNVSGKHIKTKIKTLADDDFPDIPKVDNGHKIKLPIKDMVNGLKNVWYSASVSTIKPELSSVYVYKNNDFIYFVATDSFRLAEKKVKVSGNVELEGILIPYKNVGEIIRVFDGLDVESDIYFDGNQIAFKTDGYYLVSRIVEGVFPDYKQIIPKDNITEVTILKQDLIQALKVSNVFTDNFNQIEFEVKKGSDSIILKSKNLDKGENIQEVSSTVRGEDVDIKFNQKYLVDSLPYFDSQSVLLTLNGNQKPMIIKGVNDTSFLYLVMPMNK